MASELGIFGNKGYSLFMLQSFTYNSEFLTQPFLGLCLSLLLLLPGWAD